MNLDSLLYWDRIKSIVSTFAETEAGTSYGTPAFKVNKKMFVRLKEDGETIVVHTHERERWIKRDTATFFFTDHYKNYPLMLINLKSVKKKDLEELLFASWKLQAPKRLLKLI